VLHPLPFLYIFAAVLIFQVVLVLAILASLFWTRKRLQDATSESHADGMLFGGVIYQLLRRVGFAAPLIGVFITAFLFVTEAANQKDPAKLPDLRVLFGGVLVGAAIAIANQFFLWICDSFFSFAKRDLKFAGNENSVDAVGYVDDLRVAILEGVSSIKTTTENASTETVDFFDSLRVQLNAGSTLIQEHRKLSRSLVAQSVEFTDRFEKKTAKMDAGVGSLVESLKKNGVKFDVLLAELRLATDRTTSIQDDAVGRVKRLEKISAEIKRSIDALSQSIEESTSKVSGGVVDLSSETKKMGEQVRAFLKEIDQSAADTVKRLANLGTTIDKLPRLMDASATLLSNSVEEINKAAKNVGVSSANLSKSAKQQSESAGTLNEASTFVKDGASSLKSTFQGVDQSNLKFKESLDGLRIASKDLSKQLEEQRKILKQWPEFTEKILNNMQLNFDRKIGEMAAVLTKLIQKTAADRTSGEQASPKPSNKNPR
jgi:methyl-accepting chemotaxis protein